jgi:hypothetical protein
MRPLLSCAAGIALALSATSAAAQTPLVTLGRPQAIAPQALAPQAIAPRADVMPASYGVPNSVPALPPSTAIAPSSHAPAALTPAAPATITETPRRLVRVRAQSPDFPPMTVPPPPPPPPGATLIPNTAGPAVFPGGPVATVRPNEEAYNCGLVTSNADTGGFWSRCGDGLKRCWSDMTGAVTGGVACMQNRGLFQSDHEFDAFISPVTNPVFFEDPRALTEFRPSFIWQRTRDETPFFAGGSNYFLNLQTRVAFTPWVSLVVNKLGWTWINPDEPVPGVVEQGSGFSELHIGPKVTFLRNDVSGTVAALGLNFEIPSGSARVLQDTGDLSLSPYFSIAQNFWRTQYGAFNFMNTTGYSFAVDSDRTDFFYLSAHLDYNIGNLNKYYPLIELNWTRYTFNGGARNFGFEGNNLFNFGSDGVAGEDDLTLAIGGRYKWSEAIQFGLAAEFSVLGGPRHMDDFRLTMDMIFRY